MALNAARSSALQSGPCKLAIERYTSRAACSQVGLFFTLLDIFAAVDGGAEGSSCRGSAVATSDLGPLCHARMHLNS